MTNKDAADYFGSLDPNADAVLTGSASFTNATFTADLGGLMGTQTVTNASGTADMVFTLAATTTEKN
jgi:hypothetical protein